jgi:hypothetical protein
LPGWVHSESKSQTKDDVKVVQSLIREYISNERTILLAVISAKNDYANQVILQECRNIDKDGCRTLGIITKTDTLTTPEAEKIWIDLAQNKRMSRQAAINWVTKVIVRSRGRELPGLFNPELVNLLFQEQSAGMGRPCQAPYHQSLP